MTTAQRFLNLQLNELIVSQKWKDLLLELLPCRRMIILYPLQKQQIETISKINNKDVFLLANNSNDPDITLNFLEECSINSLSA